MTSFTTMHNDHLDPDRHLWPDEEPSAFDGQVAGSHYKDFTIQPAEFIHKNGIGFLEGCVIKRMCRWRKKDGVQDLEKAIHEIQLIIEMEGKS